MMTAAYDTSWLRYGATTSNAGNFYTTTATTGSWVPINTPGTAATYTIRADLAAEPAYDARRSISMDELIREIRGEPVHMRREKVRITMAEDPAPCSEQELSDFITCS